MTELRLSAAQRVGALVAGAVLLVMAGGIFAQLLVLQDSNDRIHAQDAKIADLKAEVDPILDVVRPLAAETRPLVRSARSLADPLRGTLEDVSAAAEEAPQLARAGRMLIAESLPVVEALRLALPEIRGVLPDLRGLLPDLSALVAQASRFLDEAERRALLRGADAAIAAALNIEAIQERSLRTIRRQLAIQQETLAVQLEALEHIKSLDAKTGGEFPPTTD